MTPLSALTEARPRLRRSAVARAALAGGLLLACLFCGAASAQATPARELEAVKSLFNAGNYSEALGRARQAMAVVNFAEAERIELLKLAGLSAFNLGEGPAAEQFFYQLLLLNPDYVLDPFAAPPPAIRSFEEVRRKSADALNIARQQIALREERLRREAEERERQKARAEEQRRRLEALSRTQRTVTEKPFIVNFLPFGAGQFQQGRTGLGVLFATSEGALAATSIISIIAIEALYETHTVLYENRLGSADGKYSETVRKIPAARQTEAEVWNGLKLGSFIAFYVVWAAGIVDAVLHHQAQIITEKPLTEPAPPASSDGPGEGLKVGARLAAPRPITLSPFLFPTQGGLGGGFTLDF